MDDCPAYTKSFLRSFSRRRDERRIETVTGLVSLTGILSRPPRLLLLDIDLGAGSPDGISLLRELRASEYGGKIWMLSADESVETLAGALLAGANGYMVKGIFGRRLRREIDLVLRDDGRGDLLFHVYLHSRKLCFEQQKLLDELVAAGYPDPKQIAFQINKTDNSVYKCLSRTRSRLRLENNNQLVHLLTVLSEFGAGYRTEDGTDKKGGLNGWGPIPNRNNRSENQR